MAKICKIARCGRKVDAWGYCPRHYMQMKEHGRILERTRFDPNEFIVEENIVKIILYRQDGKPCGEALINKEDLNIVKQHKWYLNKGYCATMIKGKFTFLHQFLAGKGHDHVNRNKLDNRRINLRKATQQQNVYNTGLRKNNTSGYKGVSKLNTGWKARINMNGTHYYLGRFKTKEEAAVEYNRAAKFFFGEFGYLNEI